MAKTKTKTNLNQLLRCTVLGYRANRHTVSWTRQTAASPTPVALTFNEKVIRSYCILIINANLSQDVIYILTNQKF